MSPIQKLALAIPAIRRLRDARDALLRERNDLIRSLAEKSAAVEALRAQVNNPFVHYYACFDAEAVMRKHAVPGLRPRPGYLTNFLGVAIDPKFFPTILTGRAGEVEPVPIPNNWHADIAEWAAALRAVDLARTRFTMIELGCGWGCWMNNTGAAARRIGLQVHLIGVEGDEGHIGFAHEARETNGFSSSDMTLFHGVAAAEPGVALFPRQGAAGVSWGLEPVFGASDEQRREAVQSGGFDELPMVPLASIAAGHARIDLLHIDIQGGEADLVESTMALLDSTMAYVLIGTHSRQIEGRLFTIFQKAGWRLEIERSCIFLQSAGAPVLAVDGVQGWRNMALLPD